MVREFIMKFETEYQLITLRVLSSFQTLEFSLKIYIATAYDLIRKRLKDDIPFKYRYKDIKKHSLGMLLAIFQKLNNNTELQHRLNKLVEKRNIIAHQALLVAHEEFREIIDEDLVESHENVISLEGELDDCLMILSTELEKMFSMESAQEP